MGSLAQNSFGAIRCSCNPKVPEQVPEQVPEGSGGFQCRKLMRFRRVPAQKADEVGGFRRRKLMRFQRVPAQKADEVPEGSGAES